MPLSDLLLATNEELRRSCRGWKAPLAKPVKVRRVNPFTRKEVEVTSSDPGGDYDGDAAKSANLKGLHRVDVKGLGPIEVEQLAAVVGVPEEARKLEMAIYPPPTSEEVILALPLQLVGALAALKAAELPNVVHDGPSAAISRTSTST